MGHANPFPHNYAHSMFTKSNVNKPHIIEDGDAFNSSSDCSDFEDELLDETDSDSQYKLYQRVHSNDTQNSSLDSSIGHDNGSLDSLFTHTNGNRNRFVLTNEQLNNQLVDDSMTQSNPSLFSPSVTPKKMKVFNVSMDDEDEYATESESVSPIHRYGFRSNTRWTNDNSDTEMDVNARAIARFRQKMAAKKIKGRKAKRELVICLNGSMIDDLETHAIEQVIAEEEYYDEEESEQDFYDPNYLGVQPYYDD